MNRKRWTPVIDITEDILLQRERKKWQIALRRYVIEEQKSSLYAPYFGLDIKSLREWFALQFTEEANWDNFGIVWQLTTVIPQSHFDFYDEQDLKLCWNFTNLKVSFKNKEEKQLINTSQLKNSYQNLYNKTQNKLYLSYVDKITAIENNHFYNKAIENFTISKDGYIQRLSRLSAAEYHMINTGKSIESIESEKAVLNKYL